MKELALDREHHHQLAHDEQDLAARPVLRRAARARPRDAGGHASQLGDDVGVAGLFSQAINAGLGQALPDSLREKFEDSLGASLADVRVHTDAAAAASADAFDAHAFAHGQNIFFGPGQYQPGTPEGEHLIAHEVAHTVQQRGAAPTTQYKLSVSEPGDAMEHAADAAAEKMTRGERTGVGSAGLTIARQSRGAASPAPAAMAPAGQNIARLFPQGITVAIALIPPPETTRIEALKRQPRQTLAHYWAQLHEQIPIPSIRTELEHAVNRPDQGNRPITDHEAEILGHALNANDDAFRRAATTFAQTHAVVGGDGATPVVGQPILFLESENAVSKVLAVSRAVGPLPGSQGAGNIRHLAIFTHGWHDGIRLGSQFHGGAPAFVSQLGGALTRNVTVGIYGCNAAGGEGSFAQTVTEGLARGGHDARVFGHENPDHTTGNPRGREFLARAGQEHASSNTNYELVFSAGFRARQIADIARDLAVAPAAVEQVFDAAAGQWLVGQHTGLRQMSMGHGVVAAFEMGFDPRGAVPVAQDAWTREGRAVIQAALARHTPLSAPRWVTNTHIGRDAELNGTTWDSGEQAGGTTGTASAAPATAVEDHAPAHAAEPSVAPSPAPPAHANPPAQRANDSASTMHANPPAQHANEHASTIHTNVPEDRASAAPAAAPKPAMDPRAKTKAPMAAHAKDPVGPAAAPAATTAPTAAAPASQGTLAIVQRPGDLHPRHPGNGMVIHSRRDSHSGGEPIPPGTFVHVLSREGEWAFVSHRGRQGYVESANLREATTSEQDVRQEAEYRLAAAETGNDAGEYTEDSQRVNIGIASWTGSWIHNLLNRYRRAAIAHNQLQALYDYFGGPAHYDALVAMFAHPDMHEQQIPDDRPNARPGSTRRWHGPQLEQVDQTRFQNAERSLPFIREADEGFVHDNITTYLRAFSGTAYPFLGADRSISEVALNVIISGFHQSGMVGLPARILRTNAFFAQPQDPDPLPPPLVRARTDELTYLRHLATMLPSQPRYAQILSMYADSPRRYPVP